MYRLCPHLHHCHHQVYHCVNGDRPLNGQIGLETNSACQYKFNDDKDGDRDQDATCEWTFKTYF